MAINYRSSSSCDSLTFIVRFTSTAVYDKSLKKAAAQNYITQWLEIDLSRRKVTHLKSIALDERVVLVDWTGFVEVENVSVHFLSQNLRLAHFEQVEQIAAGNWRTGLFPLK